MKTQIDNPPAVIAAEFSARVLAYVGPEKMAEIHRRNAVETNPNVCHTHDFCDANVFMDEAFAAVLGAPATDSGADGVGCMSDADMRLWDAAWRIFKSMT